MIADRTTVRKLTAVIPLSNELLIDAGYATPELIEWQREQDAEVAAYWAALPLPVRFMRRHVSPRWGEAKHRLGHAAAALRGVECQREADGG